MLKAVRIQKFVSDLFSDMKAIRFLAYDLGILSKSYERMAAAVGYYDDFECHIL